MSTRWKIAGLLFVSAWFGIGGVLHFVAPQGFVRIVPPYLPLPALELVYVTGVFEVLAAAAIWVPAWRRATGIALFIFTICVTPANLYMSMNPQLFPNISTTALNVRLVIQVLLLACIWWSTRDSQPQLRTSGAG